MLFTNRTIVWITTVMRVRVLVKHGSFTDTGFACEDDFSEKVIFRSSFGHDCLCEYFFYFATLFLFSEEKVFDTVMNLFSDIF